MDLKKSILLREAFKTNKSAYRSSLHPKVGGVEKEKEKKDKLSI